MKAPILTVLFTQGPRDLLVSGVSEDEDVFRNIVFKSFNEALLYLRNRFHSQYRVVLNVPRNIRRGDPS